MLVDPDYLSTVYLCVLHGTFVFDRGRNLPQWQPTLQWRRTTPPVQKPSSAASVSASASAGPCA